MAKKAAMTGTQKKAVKALASEIRKAGGSRKEALRLAETYSPGGSRYKSTENKLRNTLKGEEKYLSGTKTPYKGLEEFTRGGKAFEGKDHTKGLDQFLAGGKGYGTKDFTKELKQFERGGEAYSRPDFYKEGKQGLQMAQRVLEPIQKESLRQFQQQTIPSIYGNFGREQGAGSSALNQALAAAATNLQTQLGSQLGQVAAGYGQDISRMNLGESARQQQMQYGAGIDRAQLGLAEQARQQQMQFGAGLNKAQLGLGEQARQQALQYGAASDIYGQKRAADLGYGQNTRDITSYLNQLGLGNVTALQKAGLPQMQGAFVPPYLQKQQQQGGGIGGALIGGGIGALGSFAGSEAGSAAIASLFASSKEVKDNIRDYDKGLEVLRDLEVKQYDYTIPVPGHQNDRVGLIAEDVPEEIQTFIGDIRSVDVYGLVSILVNCVKQLDQKVKMLEAK